MNRVQLLSLSMLLLAGSAAFAAEHDVDVLGNQDDRPLHHDDLDNQDAPAKPLSRCASAKAYVTAKAKAAGNLVWGDRNRWSRAGIAALAIGGVSAAIYYWPWANKKAKALKTQGEKALESLKNSKRAQIMTGATAVVGAEVVAEYYGYGLSTLAKKTLKKVGLTK